MKSFIAAAAILCATSAFARPVPLSATSLTPMPEGYSVKRVAIDADWMTAVGLKQVGDNGADPYFDQAAFLFHRTGTGPWQLVRKLAESSYSTDYSANVPIVMENGILAFEFDTQLLVFERGTTGYTQSLVSHAPDEVLGTHLSVDSERIFAGTGDCGNAAMFEKDVSGTWRITGRMTGALDGQIGQCFNFSTSGFDFSGDFGVIDTHYGNGLMDSRVFKQVPGQVDWQQVGTLPTSGSPNFKAVPTTLRGPVALLAGDTFEATRVFRRPDSTGTSWERIGTLEPLDQSNGFAHAHSIRQRNDLVLINADVWRQLPDNTFVHVAELDGPQPSSPLVYPDFFNRTVVHPLGNTVATYELPAAFPASPAPYREDFEGGSNAAWDAPAYGVVTSGATRVYRSQSLAPTIALLANSDWPNQSIEADLKPTSFAIGSGWVGLFARRQDADNYYIVALSNGAISLRKRLRGVETQLATAAAPITAGKTYRVRLETRGTGVRVRLNGVATLSAEIKGLTHGSSGLATNSATLDADNVVVSPIATALLPTLVAFPQIRWETQGGNWSYTGNNIHTTQQNSVAGGALAHLGVAHLDDQVIEAGVRIRRLGTGTDHWAGLLARYVDANNYYYLSLRSGNSLQIRKVVNGVATAIRNVPFTVSLNRVYTLRFEAIGTKLRAYVDGALLTEYADSTFPAGQFGLATNKASTEFTAVDAYQP